MRWFPISAMSRSPWEETYDPSTDWYKLFFVAASLYFLYRLCKLLEYVYRLIRSDMEKQDADAGTTSKKLKEKTGANAPQKSKKKARFVVKEYRLLRSGSLKIVAEKQ